MIMEALNLLHQSILNATTAAIDVIVVGILIILSAIIAATSFVIMASLIQLFLLNCGLL